MLHHNLTYLGNLAALEHWYRHVRSRFLPQPLLDGLVKTVRSGYDERIRQLTRWIDRIQMSIERYGGSSGALAQQQALVEKMLANEKHGAHFNYMPRHKLLGRFLSAPFTRRDLFS